ncbi:hypothetical protein TNCV_2267321 [Trichonephila clavipes]|nr:hypothetical protein TNCV_2267321 [Trichonephila clavipes]
MDRNGVSPRYLPSQEGLLYRIFIILIRANILRAVAHSGIFQGGSGVEDSPFLYHTPFDFVDFQEPNTVKNQILYK